MAVIRHMTGSSYWDKVMFRIWELGVNQSSVYVRRWTRNVEFDSWQQHWFLFFAPPIHVFYYPVATFRATKWPACENDDSYTLCAEVIACSCLWISPHVFTEWCLTHCGRVTQICVFNTVKLGTSASSPECHSTRGNVSRGITSSSTTRVFGDYFLKISVHKNC